MDTDQTTICTSQNVHIGQEVRQYCVEIVAATRRMPEVRLGASPRATLQLVRVARAQAALAGRAPPSPCGMPACEAQIVRPVAGSVATAVSMTALRKSPDS